MTLDELAEHAEVLKLRAEHNLIEAQEIEERFESEEPSEQLWNQLELNRLRSKIILLELSGVQAEIQKYAPPEQENRGWISSALRTIQKASTSQKVISRK